MTWCILEEHSHSPCLVYSADLSPCTFRRWLILFLILECLEFDLLVYRSFHSWCLGVVNALIWGGKGDHT